LITNSITNFIQLVSLQLVDWFSQTKLQWKALNKSYLHIYCQDCWRWTSFFIFSLYFIFSFLFFFFSFSIFRTTQVRAYQSCCHISHKLMAKSQDWSWDLGEWSRRFWNKVMSYNMDNTCWPHVIHMVNRVGCTVVSTDHE